MHRAVLLYLAVLVGCASGPPEQYHRGTFVRPPPAQVRPGVGLRIPGQPVRKPDVQPQPRPPAVPHTPQTRREPTFWASSEPDAPWKEREPLVLGVRLPYPEPVVRESYTWPTRQCAKRMDDVLTTVLRDGELRDGVNKNCLIARLYLHCAYEREASVKAAELAGDLKASEYQAVLAAVTGAAAKMNKTECKKGLDRDVVDSLFERATKAWEKMPL